MYEMLFDILSRPVPATLYHYSTQEGLLGIVQKEQIWATHTQHLNDRREYVHALDLVRNEIRSKRKQVSDEEIIRALDEMCDAVEPDVQSINVCVASFTEQGDSLSQWRAYGGSNGGFAIGFYGEFLKTKAKDESAFLVPCIYDPARQQEVVTKFVNAVLDEVMAYRNIKESDDEGEFFFWRHGGNLRAYLNCLAPVMKDYSFSDEREWRIITRPLMCSLEGFDYRPGKSSVIPFFRFPLAKTSEQAGEPNIREVVIGPTLNPTLSASSVGSLLASKRLMSEFTPGGPVRVRESTIPYRAW
ncbi:DUF2971 domain-containing protein [Burkholderia vietnamiensis]|jgi:hypothetical protein|uniref:DUF2971 domain-containing protein n=1 Tax=Burkholderia vietnamiensis TaxID=60552 RepID=UPI0009BF86BC|nr:DUF2971 domain-containing protein [Burkholderia vietnamiensis]MBR8049950.1 DUF2971 domain-containing protein [Burkholderia vietnamiensis]MBR8190095.1 DUF2971 domain-containing protein [Burkholderia vietnamiensis]MCA7942278.1 DUF2971 domain-containing protein [Burkholderia vietnamiensis]MDN8033887.1 DUF2971 domain-containing protein [Burkholderia vietnamiensis]CAG9209001.1 conserved hypothetical protein [Burkholderia vietnamiensis]